MKRGFRIDIQSDLSENEIKRAKTVSDDFIVRTLQHPDKRFGGSRSYGGRDTPYSRGSCLSLGDDLFFLRINRHKRIFGVVRENTITGDYGKLKLKSPTIELYTYAQIGDIKG